MKQTSLLLLALLLAGAVIGQNRRTIKVSADQDLAQAFSPNGFYTLPQFSKAILYKHKEAGSSQRLFNYNILSGTMQFISEKGDTMDLINPTLFDSIVIGQHIFVYRDGFLEQTASAQAVRLLKKTVIKLEPQNVGAYGGSAPTEAIDKIERFSLGNNVYNFRINQDVLIKQRIDWFLADENGRLLKASRENLLALLPADKKKAAEAYLKTNKIDFTKEEQVKKLFDSI